MTTIEEVLDEAVRRATGIPEAKGRPGQVMFAKDVAGAMGFPSGQVCASAPVGVGKSMSCTVPAMMRAALHGERSIVSTESISLMTQYAEKDLPTVQAAVKAITGIEVPFSVYKGWSNFVCVAGVRAHVRAILDEHGIAVPVATTVDTPEGVAAMVKLLRKVPKVTIKGPSTVDVAGVQVPVRDLIDLFTWAAKAVTSQDPSDADRNRYPGKMADGAWAAVSVSPGECAGVDTCPFAGTCAPARARERAASASVVVTNHSMLAVQATTKAPVIVGNRRLGAFEHLIVDEAHTLPGIIRAAGSCEISARRITSVAAGMKRVLDEDDKYVVNLTEEASFLAEQVTSKLDRTLHRAGPDGLVRLGEQDDPLDGVGLAVADWTRRVQKALSHAMESHHAATAIKARRAAARAESLEADVKTACEHQYGVARWAQRDERDDNLPVTKASPVDVASALQQNLWTAPVPFGEEGEALVSERRFLGPRMGGGDEPGRDSDGDDEQRYALSVTMCSGTLPQGFASQVGLRVPVKHYPSPFEKAYSSSLLYVPRCVDDDDIFAVCGSSPKARKPKLDVASHTKWAGQKILSLVEASGGSALILTATARAGREYAEMLRAKFSGQFNVYSQWDGRTAGALVKMWRDDVSSVLVGTRSLMTGTDAPGRTCQLVVVDRVPRSASNPVDDARVEAIMDRLETDRWSADRYVYVTDASLLLEQSAGRLVRSVSDRGVVAILDPRLLKTGPLRYPEATRQIYLGALAAFTTRVSREDQALRFLNELRDRS